MLLHRNTRDKLLLPIVLKTLGLKIVTQEQLLRDGRKYRTIPFGFEESITSSKPNSIGEVPEGIKITSSGTTLGKSFIAEVTNAYLVGSTAVGFDKNGNIIAETTLPPLGDLSPRFDGSISIQSLIQKKLSALETPHLDTACSLLNFWSKSYYHWFLDCLTRLEGLEYYQETTGCKPVLIIDSNPPLWQIESLKLLGYSSDDYIQWNHTKVFVKKLVVPAFRQPGNWVSPSALHWLRQRLFINIPAIENQGLSFSPRVYISRCKASRRKIINEDEVMKILSPLGFVSYTLENLSFMDQIKLFLSAEIIIGPHGAGFTNIIFSQKQLTVIEFVNPLSSPHYFLISSILGFQYWCFECQLPYFQDFSKIKIRDYMIVDIAKLQALVDELQL